MVKSNFRLNAKTLFLTYPQCPIAPIDVLNYLIQILESSSTKIQDYIIAQEEHKDTGLHIHAYLTLDKKINIRKPTYFDLEDETGTYHGNYQGARDNTAVIKYVTKDGNYVSSYPDSYIEAQRAARTKKESLVGQLIMNEGGISASVI